MSDCRDLTRVMAVDEDRVVAHFDIDCFYAQSEELRCPSLSGRPVGVTQKYLVVTSNYVARQLGVPKMVSIADAKRVLPSLVLINGEDLTPYRADSKRVMTVLRRFGTLERHGFDEGAVDITAQVRTRLQSANRPGITFQGHVLGLPGANEEDGKGAWIEFGKRRVDWDGLSPKEIQVLIGGQIVSEMRTALENETGFRCSCGVAQNKMLAKLASSLNKPSKQTCLLDGAVAGFLAPLSVRKIPGVGKQMQGGLTELGIETMADLGNVTLNRLSEKFGPRIGSFLFHAGMGRDPTPVLDKGPPKSISVEDSFRNCKTMQRASEILRGLAPDLIRRLDEDGAETERKPKTLTLKWRAFGSTWNFNSTSQKTPPEVLCSSVAVENRASVLAELMSKLLARTVKVPFDLVVLNIGATNFVDSTSADLSPGGRDIRSFLNGTRESPGREVQFVSKREARIRRESFKPMVVRRSLEQGGFFAPKRKHEDSSDMSNLLEAENELYHSNSSSDNEAEGDDFLLDEFGLSFANQVQGTRMRAIESRINRGSIPSSLEKEHSLSGWHSPATDISSGARKVLTDWQASSSVDLDVGEGNGSGILVRSESFSPAKGPPASQIVNGVIPLCEDRANGPRKLLRVSSFRVGFDAEPSVPVETRSNKSFVDIEVEESRGLDTTAPSVTHSDERGWRSSVTGVVSSNSCSAEESSGVNSKSSVMKSEKDGTFSVNGLRTRENSGAADVGKHWTCEECGELLEEGPNARQEHADYHFALSLDRPEEANLRPKKAAALEKKGPTSGQKSRPKSRTGTLDRFVVRLS